MREYNDLQWIRIRSRTSQLRIAALMGAEQPTISKMELTGVVPKMFDSDEGREKLASVYGMDVLNFEAELDNIREALNA